MLQILDQTETDLLLNPLAQMERRIASGTIAIPVYAVVNDTGRVRAELDWNDGTQPVVYAEQNSPLVINVQRNLGLGTYRITVTAFNTKSPQPDTIRVTFPWQVTSLNSAGVPPASIYGPILPRDNGLPNTQTWNFDVASDIQVLQSNIKMLLVTSKGERIMAPTYGTSLRRIIFELNVASIESILQQEIAQAVAQWEPRVSLQTLSVNRDVNNRQVTVQADFLSRLNGQVFTTSLNFTP